MRRVNAILSAAGLLVLALSMPSWAQVRQQTQTINLSGTVESIDRNQRVVHIKTEDGKFETIDVPQSAKRFDELKVGDKVSVTYNNTVTARLKPPGEAPVGTERTASSMGQEARPGGATGVQKTITATVSAIDKSASSISFVGPNGWKYSRRVADPTVLDKVKVGDQVDFSWSTDLTVSVQ
jgi:Cu/Ag efflux protein CusF